MAFCQSCGTRMAEEAVFCKECGAPVKSLPHQLPGGSVLIPAVPARRSRVKLILLIVVGILAIITICVVQSAKNTVAEGLRQGVAEGLKKDVEEDQIKAIRAVLKQDKDLDDVMTRGIDQVHPKSAADFDRIAIQISSYVEKAKEIDTSNCPRDFAEAYYRHILAWSAQADTIQAHPDFPMSQDQAFADGFLRGLAGDPTGGVAELNDELNKWYGDLKANDVQVKKTWDEVKAVAVRHGALG